MLFYTKLSSLRFIYAVIIQHFFSYLEKKKKRPLHTLSVFVINHISYSIYWELLLHRFFELIRIIFLWSWYFPYHWPPSSTVILGLIFHYLNHWLVIKLRLSVYCPLIISLSPPPANSKPELEQMTDFTFIAREKYPAIQTSADI